MLPVWIPDASALTNTEQSTPGARSGLSAWRLLAGEPVNRLPDEVGVAVVPRVLLDHVDQDPSQAWCLTAGPGAPGQPLQAAVGQCLRHQGAGAFCWVSLTPDALFRLGDEGDALAEQGAPLAGFRLGDGNPFAEHFAGGGEGAADSLGDELVDPFAGQFDDEAGVFEVDEGEELAGDADAAAAHDRALFDSRVLELKGVDEIPEQLPVRAWGWRRAHVVVVGRELVTVMLSPPRKPLMPLSVFRRIISRSRMVPRGPKRVS